MQSDKARREAILVRTPEQQPSVEVTEHAFGILMANLKRYGNEPNEVQRDALRKVLEMYTSMSAGEVHGRYAFPLPTGYGKTQSIVAWITALHVLGIRDVSVAVCASKVEALCDLKRDLMAQGVPEELIGLLHSYRYKEGYARKFIATGEWIAKGYATLPDTGVENEKQFLLVTHERVRAGKRKGTLEEFTTHHGEARNLLIWDESLFISDSRTVELDSLNKAAAVLEREPEHDTAEHWELVRYLNDTHARAMKELSEQDEQGRAPEPVHLTPLDPMKVVQIKAHVKGLRDQTYMGAVLSLLNISHAEAVRVIHTQEGVAAISFELVIDSALSNIAILDASYAIRELEQMDATIKPVRLPDNMVSYENVCVNQLNVSGSRTNMKKLFAKERARGIRPISREVAEVVRAVPEDEGVILFGYKQKADEKVSLTDVLKRELIEQDVDIYATVTDPQTGKEVPRFVFLTWGNEMSLSQHSYCKHVVLVGILHRSFNELAGKIAGQTQDVCVPITHQDLLRVRLSEITHCAYQAMSRGACRKVVAGRAQPMNAWLIHEGADLRGLIDKVMPGATWRTWEAEHVKIKRKRKMNRTIHAIAEYLEGLPASVTSISSRKLKEALNVKDTAETTWLRAGKEIEEVSSGGWRAVGRSFVRRTGAEYGFESVADASN
jgi:hypothetical protein